MHLEAIKLERQKVFKKLTAFPNFFLVGGTALALQIGHRISVDFDLFSEKDLSKDLFNKIKRVFKDSNINRIVNRSGHLGVVVDGVKIDFVFCEFPFISDMIDFEGIKMVPISEIAAMKAYALSFRGTLKDYVDMYFILKDGYANLQEIEKIADKKYGAEFNIKLFIQQLVWWEDLKRENIEFLKEPVSEEQMKKFFEQEISKIKL